MTIEEKRKAIAEHCDRQDHCADCKLYRALPFDELCYEGDADIEKNYSIIFGEDNPYWERIQALAARQRAKGIEKYGYGLEDNPAAIEERIQHLEEELIDALHYCEWIKDILGGAYAKE